MNAQNTVDLDDGDTWPTPVHRLVDEWDSAVSRTRYWQDWAIDGQEALDAALVGYRIRSYHCTRLLDHEVRTIREQGLRVFSRELFDDRINAAAAHGEVTPSEQAALLHGHMYACGEARTGRGRREGQVCAVLGRSAFADDPDGVQPLLEHWGGEGIYFASGTQALQQRLQALGTPTIVVVDIPINPSTETLVFPALTNVLLAASRGRPAHASLHYFASVPPGSVTDFWQPGHPEYDRYPELPRG